MTTSNCIKHLLNAVGLDLLIDLFLFRIDEAFVLLNDSLFSLFLLVNLFYLELDGIGLCLLLLYLCIVLFFNNLQRVIDRSQILLCMRTVQQI